MILCIGWMDLLAEAGYCRLASFTCLGFQLRWQVVEASLHVVSSSRKLPRFVPMVAEVFPAAREGKLQRRSTFQASFLYHAVIVPLTNTSHRQAQFQGMEK